MRTNQIKLRTEEELENDVTFSDAAGGKRTSGTATLLKMEASSSAPHTKRVGLVPPLSKASCSFSLLMFNHPNYTYRYTSHVYFNRIRS